MKTAAEAQKPGPAEAVKAKIREYVAGNDLGTLRQYEVYFELYPDQVTGAMFQSAWHAVMNEQKPAEQPKPV